MSERGVFAEKTVITDVGIAEKFSDFMENCLKQNRKMILRRKGGAIFLKRH